MSAGTIILRMLSVLSLCMSSAAMLSAQSTAFHDVSIVWVRAADRSLWRSEGSSLGSPRLLYGHDLGLACLVPSPCGRLVAAGTTPNEQLSVFAADRPGVRRVVPGFSPLKEWFLREWAPDGKGVLISKYAVVNSEGMHRGVYSVTPTGVRTLIAPPSRDDLTYAYAARYSPDKALLAIIGDTWFQIVDCRTRKTLMFRRGIDNQAAVSPVWIDSQRLVLVGLDALMVADVGKRSVTSLLRGVKVTSLHRSRSGDLLYAVMNAQTGVAPALHSIDPSTGRYENVPLPGALVVGELFGITSDGQTALMLLRYPEDRAGQPSQVGTYGIWLVSLTTGEHRLVAHDSILAALIE